ncbi:MAG: hypothetical protein J6S63_00360 [Atopobiaceae bacterium]|nr:hypothetical protein [Atopobiaceae bacterium]
MNENAEKFQQLLSTNAELRERVQAEVEAFEGNKSDDRAVFDVAIAPVARSVGIELTYDEMRDAVLDGRELTDDELELVAGGVGFLYQKLVSGMLVATMVFGAVPTRALAEEARPSGGADAQTAQVMDQEALDAINGYAPSFSMSDIALPDGVAATPEGLKAVSAKASTFLGEDESFVNWDNASTVVEYTADKLGYVNEDAKKIAALGKSLFDVIKGGATGDFASILEGGKAFLELTGAIEGEDEGPTNADLMGEIKELNGLMQEMGKQLDANTKQTYQNRLTIFDNAVGALGIESAKVETMFQKGYALAEKRGLLNMEEPAAPTLGELPAEPALELPAEPASPELPAEPVLELPAEPVSWFDMSQRYYDVHAANDVWEHQLDDWAHKYDVDRMDYVFDYQARSMQYKQAHEAWEAECAPIREAHDQAVAAWQAECDRLGAEHDQEVAAWQAECDRLNAEHDQAVAAWQAECDRINDENAKAQAEYEAAHAEWQENTVSKVLVQLMREEDDKGNRDFRDFKDLLNSIRQNFDIVAVECAKQGGASPFHAYDSYWALHFNFDTQGYYLRQAYRSSAEYQLKRAYSLLGLYFDIPTELETNPNEAYTIALKNALNGIDAQPVGQSPEEVRYINTSMANFYYAAPVHSYTLNRDFQRSYFANTLASLSYDEDYFSDKEMQAFFGRLHGRTVAEDLRLAGIMIEYDDSWNQWLREHNDSSTITPQSYCGLGVRHDTKDGWKTYYVPFDATSYDLQSYDETHDSNAYYGSHQVLHLSQTSAADAGLA